MMIFIGADYTSLGLSPEQMQERMGKWFAWQAKMEKSGNLVGGHALEPDVKRVSGPARTITDGPFMESKELVGGYYIIKANDPAEVVKVAEDFPDYDLGGTVEIRKIMVFD